MASSTTPAGTLTGPTSGVAYYESLAGASGPTPLAVGQARLRRPPRIWLVIRDSDAPPPRRTRIESVISAGYHATITLTGFRNLTVILYSSKPPSTQLAPRQS
jgi:hypothetical protein